MNYTYPYKPQQKDYRRYVPEAVQAILEDHPTLTITYSTAYTIDWHYSEARDDAGRAEVVENIRQALDEVEDLLRQTEVEWETATPRWTEAKLARMDLGSRQWEKRHGGVTVRGTGWKFEKSDDGEFRPNLRIRWHAFADPTTETPIPLDTRRQRDTEPGYAKALLYEAMITPIMAEWNEPCIERYYADYWFDRLDEHVHDDNGGNFEYFELWSPRDVYEETLIEAQLALRLAGDREGKSAKQQLAHYLPQQKWLMERFDQGYIASRIPYQRSWWH